MSLRARFELSDRAEEALARLLQLVLFALFVFGVVRGDVGVAFNASAALLVSRAPSFIRRETGLTIDVSLVLLITVAAALHALGTLGPYRTLWWWDYLTHALSAFTVTGIAYAVVVSVDRHANGVSLPQPFLSLVLVLFSVAAAVLWEVVEFAATKIAAVAGTRSVLIVFGVSDIATDIVFTTLGGVVVALGGTSYFRSLARTLVGRRPDG